MIRHGLAIILLTLISQLGGIAWLVAIVLRPVARFWTVFVLAYLGLSVGAHYVAPGFGRVPLPCLDAGPTQIAVLNPVYCALNRNYVDPALKSHADALAAQMHDDFPGTRTRALDAGFPFVEGFPLLPHLSHDDGQKLDLALYYTDQDGTYQLGRARSPIGYWAFEQPPANAATLCDADGGFGLRWDMDWAQSYMRPWPLDEDRTAAALAWLANNPTGTDYAVFVEPHLAERLGVNADVIRFQGCQAARHDDHIHLQFQP
ncbi:hypothetical protein [Yoonia sp. SS1-5]|uniref:Uncharacterized protein n=1 Tax=Yoonia rhodophyticola TaxID=3137370 RepID=A0AAN0MD85_9RHOB